MPSDHFEKFRWSCFDDSFHAHHDGLNVHALLHLEGSERQTAEDMLLEAIETSSDSRPIQAAGHLRLAQAAPILKRRLGAAYRHVENTIHAAWALWRIEQYPPAATIILQALANPANGPWARTAAIDALADFPPTSEITAALRKASEDDDHLVRQAAMNALRSLS